MFASIRTYEGVTDVAKVGQGVEKLILPILKERTGFISYNLVNTGNNTVMSISIFDTHDQAEAANTELRELVRSAMSSVMPYPPKAVIGEVISHLGQ